MLEGAYTCQQLADRTGLHYVTVLRYTRELYRARAAYICTWEKDKRGRDNNKVYKIGMGFDAKRIKLSAAERQRRHRSKVRNIRLINAFGGRSARSR